MHASLSPHCLLAFGCLPVSLPAFVYFLHLLLSLLFHLIVCLLAHLCWFSICQCCLYACLPAFVSLLACLPCHYLHVCVCSLAYLFQSVCECSDLYACLMSICWSSHLALIDVSLCLHGCVTVSAFLLASAWLCDSVCFPACLYSVPLSACLSGIPHLPACLPVSLLLACVCVPACLSVLVCFLGCLPAFVLIFCPPVCLHAPKLSVYLHAHALSACILICMPAFLLVCVFCLSACLPTCQHLSFCLAFFVFSSMLFLI